MRNSLQYQPQIQKPVRAWMQMQHSLDGGFDIDSNEESLGTRNHHMR